MKEIIQGQVGDLGIGYEVKVEDGAVKVSAVLDVGILISKGEQMLPEGSLKPVEVLVLDLVKSAVKSL